MVPKLWTSWRDDGMSCRGKSFETKGGDAGNVSPGVEKASGPRGESEMNQREALLQSRGRTEKHYGKIEKSSGKHRPQGNTDHPAHPSLCARLADNDVSSWYLPTLVIVFVLPV